MLPWFEYNTLYLAARKSFPSFSRRTIPKVVKSTKTSSYLNSSSPPHHHPLQFILFPLLLEKNKREKKIITNYFDLHHVLCSAVSVSVPVVRLSARYTPVKYLYFRCAVYKSSCTELCLDQALCSRLKHVEQNKLSALCRYIAHILRNVRIKIRQQCNFLSRFYSGIFEMLSTLQFSCIHLPAPYV
jgi:hypothetical protein